ncbi:unnamed protein product [Enterobius vermicularis]|uniref:Ovule protein n=1 Tax=Enterobius vermicularis TaxID=51028 RepID=A0A0N4UVH3_ENTVE|nr:unnamed protein product [Enterobius vermicularis]
MEDGFWNSQTSSEKQDALWDLFFEWDAQGDGPVLSVGHLEPFDSHPPLFMSWSSWFNRLSLLTISVT